ncbi:MAG TPA: amidohydrolase [Planctomycetota bacterium]
MTDLLLVNGLVRTMDPGRPTARSIACADGKVEALDVDVPAKRVIDLRGATVVPGFVDAHAHLLMLGRRRRELDLTGVADEAALAARVAARAKELPEGAWITGSGWALQEPPGAAALDAAAPAHPVWLVRKDAHSGVANARAMALAGASRERGLFLENDMALVERLVPAASPAADFLAAQKEAIRFGVTAVHDALVDEDYLRLLRSLDDGRSLRVRIHAMFWNADPERLIAFMRATPPVSGPRLSVRAVKLFMDGSLGSSTAWMLRPARGVARLDAAAVERIARAALETGYQVCAHAIGDRANRELLDVFERVDPKGDVRWRVEHAQHVDPDDLPRFGRWIASIQPSHAVADRALVEARLGPRETEGSYAWSRLGRLALGSDAPVDALDPRWTFYCAVTREGWRTSDCLAPEAALRGMTADAAWAGFMDGGVLAPGRPADLAVLSRDWVTAVPKDVLSSEILATIMDGRVASRSPELKG